MADWNGDPLQGDQTAKDAMEAFSKQLLTAIETGHGPRGFLWTNTVNAGAWLPSDDPRDYRSIGHRRALQAAAEKEAALARRVSRDPCPHCGTRVDVGCKHRRIA